MKAPHLKELPSEGATLFLVVSWKSDGWPKVEGVFDEESKARGVATSMQRTVGVCPLLKNVVLPDLDDWPGAFVVNPEEPCL